MAVTERGKAARTRSATARGEDRFSPTVSAKKAERWFRSLSLKYLVVSLLSCTPPPPRDTTPLPQTHRTLALAPWMSKRPRALVTTEAIVEWRRMESRRKRTEERGKEAV